MSELDDIHASTVAALRDTIAAKDALIGDLKAQRDDLARVAMGRVKVETWQKALARVRELESECGALEHKLKAELELGWKDRAVSTRVSLAAATALLAAAAVDIPAARLEWFRRYKAFLANQPAAPTSTVIGIDLAADAPEEWKRIAARTEAEQAVLDGMKRAELDRPEWDKQGTHEARDAELARRRMK